MNKKFKGIELIGLDKNVAFSHSYSAYVISGGTQERDENIDYFDALLEREKSKLSPEQFDEISALSSVANMNYQICNGGIAQYFYNRYDKYNPPMNENDVAQLSKDKQCEMLDALIIFGLEVFPDREEDNIMLEKVVRQFKDIYVEKVEQFETIYSDEDKEIWDEDTKDWVLNPAYEEPYEAYIGLEDELVNSDYFDDNYYKINDYLELLMEGYAQYLTKSYDKEIQSLDEKINEAHSKTDNLMKEETTIDRQGDIRS